MSVLDKILSRPDTEKKLRQAARQMEEIMNELGLTHKQQEGEMEEVEPTENKMEISPDDLMVVVADAIAEAMGTDALPENLDVIARTVTEAVLGVIEMMMTEEVPVTEGAVEGMDEAERVYQRKQYEEALKLLDGLTTLQDTLITEQVEIGDDMTAMRTDQDAIRDSVVAMAASVKAMTTQVKAVLGDVHDIKHQLRLRPRSAIESLETAREDGDLPDEVRKQLEDDAYETDPVLGVRVRKQE